MNKNGFNSLNGSLDTPVDTSFAPPLEGQIAGTLDAAPLVVPEALPQHTEIPKVLKVERPEKPIKPLRGEVSGVTEMPAWNKAEEFTETPEDRHLRDLTADSKGTAQYSLTGSLMPEENFSSKQGQLTIPVDNNPPASKPATSTTTLSGHVSEAEVPPEGSFFRSSSPDEAHDLWEVIADGNGGTGRSVVGALDSKPAPVLPKSSDVAPVGEQESEYTVANAPWGNNTFKHNYRTLDIRNLPPDFFDRMTPEQQKAWSDDMKARHPKAGIPAPARDETDYSSHGEKLSWREKLAAGRLLAVAGINAVFSRPAVDAATGTLEEGFGKAKDKLAEGALAAVDGVKFVADKMREAMTSQTKKIADTKVGKKLFTPEGMLTKTGRNVFAVGTVATGLLVLGTRAFLQYKYQIDTTSGSAAPTPTFDPEQTGAPFTPEVPHIGPTQTTEVPIPETTTHVPEVTTHAPETPQTATTTVPTQETSVPRAKTPILDDVPGSTQPLPNTPLSKGPDLVDQPLSQPNTFERPATIQLARGETVWGRLQNMMPPNSTNQDMVNELVRFFEANKLPIDWDSDDPFKAARSITPSQELVVPK